MSEKEIISNIRNHLQFSLDEWIGNHYPATGTEDYETWQARQKAIDLIKCPEDVRDYAAQFENDEDEFMASWGL
jgi:HEPN domain-containing protein